MGEQCENLGNRLGQKPQGSHTPTCAQDVKGELQGRLEELERELLEVNGNAERLARSFSELVELQLVLEKASAFFDDAQHRASTATFQAQPADTGSEFLLLGHRPFPCSTASHSDPSLSCCSVKECGGVVNNLLQSRTCG